MSSDSAGQRQRAEAMLRTIGCYPWPYRVELLLEYATTARQEALKEARLAVAGEMCDEPDHACGSLQRILDDIDRLAREGVK
jgi:hypothetical protein